MRWNCDVQTADRICNFNRHYAEYRGYFDRETSFFAENNLKLVGAPDWGAVGAAKEPVVGRLGARQSPAQRAQTFNLLSGAHLAPQARVRVAAAPPTRSLFEYSVPPPGVSELGAHLFAEVSPKKLLPGTRPTLGVAGGRAN